MNSTTASAWAKSLFLCLALSCAVCAMAAEVRIPELTGRVVDNAGMLSQGGRQVVEGAILRLESQTGGQMAVLTVKSLDGSDIETFGIKTAEKWKIGHKGKDNGAILIISLGDRKTRLEIGYGWEGFVNDARAGDILRDMAPYFRSGDIAGGMAYAVDSVSAFVSGKPQSSAAPQSTKKAEAKGPLKLGGFELLILGVIVIILLLRSYSSNSGYGTFGGGGYSGGGFFGGGGGGGFSGGGGGFGGGGSSGSW